MSGLLNKVKSAVSGDHGSTTHSTTTSTTTGVGHNNTSLPEGTAGPHSSRVGNAADPRIDSDLDSSRGGLGHSTHNQTSGGLNSATHNPLSSTHGTTHNTTSTHNPLSGSHGTGVGGTPYNTTGGSAYQSHVPATGNHSHTANHSSNTTAGVHNSNLLNKADPTVDSDLSGGNHMGAQSNARTAGFSGTGSSGVGSGSSGLNSSTHNTNVAHSSHAGSHQSTGVSHATGDSKVPLGIQKAVPAGVERALPNAIHDTSGHSSHVTGSGLTGSTHNTSSGLTGSHSGVSHTQNAGPHQSNMANAADPRVDSDRSHVGHAGHTGSSGLTGSHNASSGLTGTHNTSSNNGPHQSNMANVADPRIDSDNSKSHGHNVTSTGAYSAPHSGAGTGTVGGIKHDVNAAVHGSPAAVGSGNAPKTAGPHSSDLLNKLDPRVDSDLSGGKTYGGNKTHT